MLCRDARRAVGLRRQSSCAISGPAPPPRARRRSEDGFPPGSVDLGESQIQRSGAAQHAWRSLLHDLAFKQAARRQNNFGIQKHGFEQSRLHRIAGLALRRAHICPAEESCTACRAGRVLRSGISVRSKPSRLCCSRHGTRCQTPNASSTITGVWRLLFAFDLRCFDRASFRVRLAVATCLSSLCAWISRIRLTEITET